MLAAPLLANCTEAIRHEKCFFVMARLANIGGPLELAGLVRAGSHPPPPAPCPPSFPPSCKLAQH